MGKTTNISLPEDVRDRLDEEAKKLGLNRSAYVSMALMQKWQQDDAMNSLPSILEVLKQRSGERQTG